MCRPTPLIPILCLHGMLYGEFYLFYAILLESQAGHGGVQGGYRCIIVGKGEAKVNAFGDLNLGRRMQLK